MKFVDLFCGIGGFHVALSKFGHNCIFACDIDKHCQSVYKDNFDVDVASDIRDWSGKIEPHDILCAGFPCQPFSKSGSQLGFRDKVRGTLFGEISKVVEINRPSFVFLENVANIRGHDEGRTLKTIRTVLQELGYSVRTKILSPHQFGIPHHRPRLFIVGINKSKIEHWAKFNFPKPSISKENNLSVTTLEEYCKDPEKPTEDEILSINHWTKFMAVISHDVNPPSPTWSMEFGRSYPLEDIHPISLQTKSQLCRVLNDEGIRTNTRLTKQEILKLFPPYIRNMKTEMPPWKRRFINNNREFWNEHKEKFPKEWLEITRGFTETHQKFEWQVGPSSSREIMDHMVHFRPSGIRVSKLDKIPSLVAIAQIPLIGPWGRRITVREAGNAQSFPEDFRFHKNRAIAFKQLGNSVNVQVIAKIVNQIMKISDNN